MKYHPKVNDYVFWEKNNGVDVMGWVYFYDSEYITIEVGVKEKEEEQVINGTHHRKEHVLVVCPNCYWKDLIYIKSRQSVYCEENNVSSEVS